METRDILDFEGNKVGELSLPRGTSEEVWAEKLNKYRIAPKTEQEQSENKYASRISSRNKIMVAMLVECENRVRSEVWTQQEFETFLQEEEVLLVLHTIHLLSFDLAIRQISALSSPLSDDALKKRWIEILRGHS